MVARTIVELDPDPHEWFARSELQPGRHHGLDRCLGAGHARWQHAHRQFETALDDELTEEWAGGTLLDRDRQRRVHRSVVRRRRVVVAVAEVAAVHEAPNPDQLRAVAADAKSPVVVDQHVHDAVRQRTRHDDDILDIRASCEAVRVGRLVVIIRGCFVLHRCPAKGWYGHANEYLAMIRREDDQLP